ncbi:hypothetical protein JR064_00230 [Xanthomonas sp. CFBP 8703]|uniref:Uncharacterized protein n=1 Tax=Xanthomonas bonasiae TaxID=2810351 RepID=A0ABS3AX30_9XANT|nr:MULTISPECIES: hypothetical protein [Xanthomonas]MBN6100593.1 hypothetical protein [Xanthomonas bonasiae]MBN6111380.1 hypothetical protein [Xanthomonas bonasiae]NYF18565.1 hypothetical protein [Xanthomonas sp. JAI131]
MISDQDTAEKICNKILNANASLDEAIALAMDAASEEEAKRIRQVIGRISGELLLNLLNPLYREHPSIKPDGFFLPEDYSRS